jgi:beta-mannosidase
MLDLGGQWSLKSADGKHTAAIAIPGDIHSALVAAKIIPHPYEGLNEALVQWVAQGEWSISREFDVESPEDRYLDITYLDTVATVLVNGEEVLKARNCFRRYRPDVSKVLKAGTNSIEIVFHSNIEAAAALQEKQPFHIPYAAQNCPIPNGNMLRKPACHFGWDWNLAIAPFGLYGPVSLRKLGKTRIETIETRQTHNEDGSVDVDVTVALFSRDSGVLEFTFALAGQSKGVFVRAAAGTSQHTERFRVAEPELWWPSGSGAQKLYDLRIECGGEVETRRVGLRRIELITAPDKAGSRFVFRVNGREVFCRGANWIPADALPSAATPALARKLLQAAADANMNMIRVWGGGFYEADVFYDICDELGLMVWQDFMFACNLYPSTPDFVAEVRAEVDYQVKRLGSHACLALWCGDNELIGALTWFEESRNDRDRYLVNYDRLNRAIEDALRQADPQALWWPSSPSPGVLSFGDAWHSDASGDMHFWSVWHEGRNFEHYRDVRPRFCSEFGFQSFPSLNLARKFAGPADLNIASPVMEAHQKNRGGNARIAETMFRYFRFPSGFEDFVYLSQIQHGLAMRTAVEYWRSLKPHCMGALYWQLNDTWPAASWSGLDHGGGWKALHYMARRFFEPAAVFAVPAKDGGEIAMVGVNDRIESVTVKLACYAVWTSGQRKKLDENEASIPPDRAKTLLTLKPDAIPDGALLVYHARYDDGSEQHQHFAPLPYKSYSFEDPELQLEIEGKSLHVSAKRPAYYVMVEADVPGHFSDNAFDLMPGERKTVGFKPARSGAAVAFTVRDLFSATHR